MRKIFLIILLCKCTYTNAQVQLVDSIINKETLYQHVSALAHDSMRGRQSGTKQNKAAGEYITSEFKKMGLLTINNIGYAQPVIVAKKYYGNNIIGVIEGLDSIKKDTLIIFSAHYDHIGGSYNGANDNASGVAGMMSLAKYFMQIDNAYTLLFIAFTGEEHGMIGSQFFVRSINTNFIKLNINLEMLGRPKGNSNMPYFISNKGKQYLNLINENLSSQNDKYGKNYFKPNTFIGQNLELRSDHFSFNQFRVNAFTIMNTSPTDKHYHQTTDETKTLDFDAITNVVKAIALATTPFVE